MKSLFYIFSFVLIGTIFYAAPVISVTICDVDGCTHNFVPPKAQINEDNEMFKAGARQAQLHRAQISNSTNDGDIYAFDPTDVTSLYRHELVKKTVLYSPFDMPELVNMDHATLPQVEHKRDIGYIWYGIAVYITTYAGLRSAALISRSFVLHKLADAFLGISVHAAELLNAMVSTLVYGHADGSASHWNNRRQMWSVYDIESDDSEIV